MESNKLIIHKYTQENCGGIFEFTYEGVLKKNAVANPKTQELIYRFVNQIASHQNIATDVCFIKTILKDYEENKLVVSYQKEGLKETVRYEKGILMYFEKKEKYVQGEFVTQYTPANNVTFTYKTLDNERLDPCPDISIKVSREIYEVRNIDRIQQIKIDPVTRSITEVYKLFYDEYPDFSDKDIDSKVHSMLLILEEFKIYVDDFHFSLEDRNSFPSSFALRMRMMNWFPLGEVKEIDPDSKLSREKK